MSAVAKIDSLLSFVHNDENQTNSLADFRYPISFAICESACSWLNDSDQSFTSDLSILIAQFMGYNRFINYKWNYPPNGKPFNTADSICQPFGFLAGQRVRTPEGNATVIGVAPLPPDYDYQNRKKDDSNTPNELHFDLDSDEYGLQRRQCWPGYRQQQFNQHGFVLLDEGMRVNIWGQSFHSFVGKKWWNDQQYLKYSKIKFFNQFGDPNDPRYKSIKYVRESNENDDDDSKENEEIKVQKNKEKVVLGLDED